MPLLFSAVHGHGALQEVVEGWLQLGAPVLLCALVVAAESRIRPLERHARVRLQSLDQHLEFSTRSPSVWAVWVYPHWQHIHHGVLLSWERA
jgi:hypothetical protein